MLIKEISNINPISNLKKHLDFINYIDTSSVLDGKLLNIQKLYNNFPSRAQRYLKENDILISSVRPNLLHNYFCKNNIQNGIASTGFIQIRIKVPSIIHPRFLYYFLTSTKNILKYTIVADSSQTTIPSFNKDIIENLGLPDIPYANQQHIVDTKSRLKYLPTS